MRVKSIDRYKEPTGFEVLLEIYLELNVKFWIEVWNFFSLNSKNIVKVGLV